MTDSTNNDSAPTVTPRRRGRPGKGEQAVERDTLLEQAFRHFAELGFEAMSVRELATELGVRDSLIHHHFGSKQDLWYAAVRHVVGNGLQRGQEELSQPATADDPLERLRQITFRILMATLQHRTLFRLIFRETEQDSERSAFLQQYTAPFFVLLDNALREAQQRKALPDGPLDSLHVLVIGAARMLTSPSMLRQRLSSQLNDQATAEPLVKGMVDRLFPCPPWPKQAAFIS